MGRLLDEDTVIKVLERWQKAFRENSHYVSASDLSLVVKDVRELPPAQPVATDTNVGDTISRQAAVDAAKDWYEGLICGSVNGLIKKLKALPTVQPKHKKGWWLPDNRPGGGFWVCSECKFPSEAFAANVLYKFCPNCGADMRGEKDG